MAAKKSGSSRKRSRPAEPKKANPNVKTIIILAVIAIVIVVAVTVLYIGINTDGNQNNGNTTEDNPIAVIDTSMGTINVELYIDKAPITAGNFINLSNDGYYDGLIFHRVIPDFMIQGGCPNGDGTGGPGYKIPDEFHEDLSNIRGAISMANSGPNTGGSQFFINVVDNTYLDYDKEPLANKHAVFGTVIDGMDVVDTISEVQANGNKPVDDVTINSITIESK